MLINQVLPAQLRRSTEAVQEPVSKGSWWVMLFRLFIRVDVRSKKLRYSWKHTSSSGCGYPRAWVPPECDRLCPYMVQMHHPPQLGYTNSKKSFSFAMWQLQWGRSDLWKKGWEAVTSSFALGLTCPVTPGAYRHQLCAGWLTGQPGSGGTWPHHPLSITGHFLWVPMIGHVQLLGEGMKLSSAGPRSSLSVCCIHRDLLPGHCMLPWTPMLGTRSLCFLHRAFAFHLGYWSNSPMYFLPEHGTA